MCAGGSCWIEGFSFIRDDSEHLHNYTDALLNLKFEVSLVELSFKLPFIYSFSIQFYQCEGRWSMASFLIHEAEGIYHSTLIFSEIKCEDITN